jgi:site-specific DNA-cytosine methylase
MGYRPWRPARDIIDWSIPGTSIFDRRKPLADATIRRIAAGTEKYWKDYAKPVLAVLYGTSTATSLDMPLSSVTASGAHHALVEPFITKVNHSGGDRVSPIKEPLGTLTTTRDNAIITACGLDLRFRMLKNHELKKAQGFPDDYVITGNTTEQTKQIGNAVPVNTAKALALAAMGA